MEIFVLKAKGFTLVNQLFAFSIYIMCIIMFVSLYNQAKKYIIFQNEQNQQYLIDNNKREQNICIDNGLEKIIQDLH